MTTQTIADLRATLEAYRAVCEIEIVGGQWCVTLGPPGARPDSEWGDDLEATLARAIRAMAERASRVGA